jgi:hypothetical protein
MLRQLPEPKRMHGALITSFSVAGSVILLLSTRHLFDSEKGIQNRWEGAVRHSIAVAVALCAIVVLFTLLQLLDLFERDFFSLYAFLDILQLSFALLVSGGMVILTVMVVARR